MAIDIAMPGCRCSATKRESELSTVLGIPEEALRLVVPVKAQLRYNPHAVNLGFVVDGLKGVGCEVVTESAVFKIPSRPALPPFMWTEKIKSLAASLRGVVSASVNFQTSQITVDYVPALTSRRKIHGAVIGWGLHSSSAGTRDVNMDEDANVELMFNFFGRRAA